MKDSFLSKLINPLPLWSKYIINRLTENDSINRLMRDHNVYITDDALMSRKDNVAYMYTIDGYPNQLPNSYRSVIRREAKDNVKINFLTMLDKDTIDWNSTKIKAKKNTWKSAIEDREEVDEFSYIDNMDSLSNDSWKLESLVYLPKAEIQRDRQIFKLRSMMLVTGKRGEEFDKVVSNVEATVRKLGLTCNRVLDSIEDYLYAYSPFIMGTAQKISSGIGRISLTDEIIARFSEYSQGKVGKTGFYMGTDVYSGFPVFKQFKKRTTDAENILITAKTGFGKSFLAKCILAQMSGNDNYRLTIQDIEGYEYLYLGSFVNNNDNVVIVNMGDGSGSYFDAVEIVRTGNEEIDAGSFSISRAFTTNLFSILIGDKVMEDSWVEDIISNAVAKTYIDAGVDGNDQSTWGNSVGLTYQDVYRNIKDTYLDLKRKYAEGVRKANFEVYDLKAEDKLKEENPDSQIVQMGIRAFELNDGFLNAYDKVVAKLIKYFEDFDRGGTHSSFFTNRISLEEIKDAKMVINSFGLAGKSEGARDSNVEALSQLFATFIGQIRTLYSKVDGKYNVKVFEEFQRWGKFKGSERTIGEALTGGRKMGDVNIIITNVLKELIDDNKFNIFQNITSFCIGMIGEAETRKRVCEELSVENMLEELDTIATEAGDAESFAEDYGDLGFKSPYDKAFLVSLDSSVTTTVRIDLPPEIAGSSMFKTATKQDLEDILSSK
jgi:hypothetical protein